MGRIVGIDLGTTYSAVAIPEEHSSEGFLVIKECPGYSVILDRLHRPLTPSVVAENKRGEIVVGYPAKAHVGLFPGPIMFAKRHMGEDKTFQLAKQGTLRPEEVSAHLLRYLKHMAEERLGEPVDEAVITVPAYFLPRAIEATQKAAEHAGLRVAQIVREPVAAALTYCAADPRDPLLIMTYNLGGGGFEVAILQKHDGEISIVALDDGHRFVVGYDFDENLALWILDQLEVQGYDLQLDLEDPADQRIFAKLMIYAERAKVSLSREEICAIHESNTGIRDHAGNPVDIALEITRDQFEAMIRPQIERTIRLCRQAMAQISIGPDQLDEIVMVGGSSRIPLVTRCLTEAFEKNPRLITPDLCVAVGAAIVAGTREKTLDRPRSDLYALGVLMYETLREDVPLLTVPNILSKPLGILTAAGPHMLAPEGTRLPYEAVWQTTTMDTSGEIRVPIVEGNNPLYEIVVKDIPTTLPIGTLVEITLGIQENYQIYGRVFVPSLGRNAQAVLVREVGKNWKPEPPPDVFEQKADEAQKLLAQAIRQKPEVAQEGYDRVLEELRAHAERAYTIQNIAAWKDSFNQVVKLCDRLEAIIETARSYSVGQEAPDPAMLLLSLAHELDALEKRYEDQDRYSKFKDEFEEL